MSYGYLLFEIATFDGSRLSVAYISFCHYICILFVLYMKFSLSIHYYHNTLCYVNLYFSYFFVLTNLSIQFLVKYLKDDNISKWNIGLYEQVDTTKSLGDDFELIFFTYVCILICIHFQTA